MKLAIQMLEDKYNENFIVFKKGNRTGKLFDENYMVIAAPSYDENMKFRATIAFDQSYLSDEYISRTICNRMEKNMEKLLHSSLPNLGIKIGCSNKYIASTTDSSIALEEFLKLEPSATFTIYLVIDIQTLEQMSSEKFYNALQNALKNFPTISGHIKIYIDTEETLLQFLEWKKEYANIGAAFDEIVEDAFELSIAYKNNNLELDLSAFQDIFDQV